MNNEYIEKIVSHIKNSSSKGTSQAELTDHYIEKQRFYEEIGYDEEAAGLKTQEDIGDPDMIGEQLNVKSKKTVNHYIPLLFSFYVNGLIMDYYTSISAKTIIIETIVWFLMPVFMLLILVKAIKQKAVAASVISLLGSMHLLHSHIVPIITDIVTGANTAFIHFRTAAISRISAYDFEMDYAQTQSNYLKQFASYEKIYTVLCVVFIGIVAVCGIWSIFISIRTIRLKNTKRDYHIALALRIIVIAVTVITVAASVIDIVKIASFPYNYNSTVRQELTAEDEKMLKMINSGELDHAPNYDDYPMFSKRGTAEFYCGDGFVALGITTLDKIKDEISPMFSRREGKEIIEKMSTVTSLDDAPKPYEMQYLIDKQIVSITYTCDYYGELRYDFTKEDEGFVLSESVVRTELDINPSAEVRAECENILKDYLKNDYYKDEFELYPDSEIYFISTEYKVNYDAASDTYEFLYYDIDPVVVAEYEGRLYLVSNDNINYDQIQSVRITPKSRKVRIQKDGISKSLLDDSDFDYSSISFDDSQKADYLYDQYGVKLSGFIYYIEEKSEYFVHDFN